MRWQGLLGQRLEPFLSICLAVLILLVCLAGGLHDFSGGDDVGELGRFSLLLGLGHGGH